MSKLINNFFFSSIVDAVVIHDKETKRSRGFGFVTYEAEESANLVLRTNFHLLYNKRVEVKKVTPRKEMVPTGFGFPPYYYDPYYQTYFYSIFLRSNGVSQF
ncbi:hypothetical protein V6Z11_A05G310000 [Gossypium hirsutum]